MRTFHNQTSNCMSIREERRSTAHCGLQEIGQIVLEPLNQSTRGSVAGLFSLSCSQ